MGDRRSRLGFRALLENNLLSRTVVMLRMIKALSRLFSFLLAISNLYNTPESFVSKSILLIRIVRNRLRVTSATGFVEQLAMISALLRLPASVNGSCVVCGRYG